MSKEDKVRWKITENEKIFKVVIARLLTDNSFLFLSQSTNFDKEKLTLRCVQQNQCLCTFSEQCLKQEREVFYQLTKRMQIPKGKKENIKSSQKHFGFLKISGGIKGNIGLKHGKKFKSIRLTLWWGNFVEKHSFCRLSDELPKTLRKLDEITVFSAVKCVNCPQM